MYSLENILGSKQAIFLKKSLKSFLNWKGHEILIKELGRETGGKRKSSCHR
jgi:hypothetical protein